MKWLVVGNSHGSVMVSSKLYNRGDVWSGIDVDFYLIPGPFAPLLVERDGRFYPERDTKALRSTIPNVQAEGLDVTPYDAIVFSAFGLPAARNVHIESGRHPLGAAHLLGWRKPGDGPQALVSERHMLDLVWHCMATSGSFRFLSDAARLFKGPIYVQTVADPAVGVLDDGDWLLRRQLGDGLRPALAQFAEIKDRAIVGLLQSLPDNVVPMLQPRQMTIEPGFIKPRYGRPRDPFWHTSHLHGQLVVLQIRALQEGKPNRLPRRPHSLAAAA